MRKKLSEIAGYFGMVLIHGATLPAIIGNLLGSSKDLPPLSMVVLVWLGLGLFLWRAIEQKDLLYILSNATGFFFNSLLLFMILMN
jgi:hypothetical protein